MLCSWTAAEVSVDGKRLYSDRVLRESVWVSRWEAYAREGRQPVALEGHQGSIQSLAVGIDGKVFSASNDWTIKVWRGTNGSHLYTLAGHTSIVLSLAIGMNGWVYSGSSDRTIRVWCGETGGFCRRCQSKRAMWIHWLPMKPGCL
eukprot:m.293158 g.293158  ORF g.293158 m.293158 type:complete len:146 (-) comp16240_c0_seq2:738-1175(-)